MKVRPAAVIVENDRILTMRYVYGNTEVFALPGGNPDLNECLTKALERELMEELGVTVAIGQLVICGEVLWTEQNRDTLHMVFLSKIISGVPVLNEKETTALEIVWLPVATLDQMLLYPNVGANIIRHIKGDLPSAYTGIVDQPYLR